VIVGYRPICKFLHARVAEHWPVSVTMGGATILKVGYKKFLDPSPTFDLPGGHKTELYNFHYLHQMIITVACRNYGYNYSETA